MSWKNKHDLKKVALVVLTILFYSTVLLLNQLSSRKILFPTDIGSLSRKYRLDITPIGYVFAVVWSTIYLWQAVWLLYVFITLFRRTEDGDLVYRKVDILPTGFFIAFILNNIGMITWLFLWTNELIGWSFACLTYLTLALCAATYISLKNFYHIHDELLNFNLKRDIWLNRVLIHNGLAFYLTWVTIASCLNMATYLTYDLKVELSLSTTIALGVIALLTSVYFLVENFIWQKYLLYVFTPWIVLAIALSGSLIKNWSQSVPTRNNIITLIILSVSVLYSIVKVVMFSLYHTVCRQKVDRKESHKLLQMKQNQMNDS